MTEAQTNAASFLSRLKGLWRDIARSDGAEKIPALSPGLPDGDLARLRIQMEACLDAKGGEVSARARAAALGRAYLSLSAEGRARFLKLLAGAFGPDRARVDAAAAALGEAREEVARLRAEMELRQALEPPRLKLLTQFNALPEGVKFLVDMRAELMGLMRDHPDLAALEADLKGLLTSWFDVGFLVLERVTWRSSAAVLEKIMQYEAVHAIQGWTDLKNRLDSDRRLYAFFHPRMPDEPLIFVEVALLPEMAGNIQDLLDPTAPLGDVDKADTAIFYSINNAQRGLAGISFGNFLIKRVVDDLSREFKQIKTFATLSPIPGFRRWLDGRLTEGEPGLLSAAEHKDLTRVTGGMGAKGSLKALLAEPDWTAEPLLAQALEGPLTRLAARYLTRETRSGGMAALDPVAHFHLSNGARVERINWMADMSPNGLAQSAGLMVNYLYDLDDIEANHEAYSATGKLAVSARIKALLKG
ncbi:Malonyl-CoA decarboxylase [Paramagnetospirillum magnetotacticum MS-1]|uniref:Malonyl-CoA decarboxylase n=1 Tax=Paramagnetospirillum magnetotacticum MS-1 TaxID=272627 RepID=A0A0C2UA76_PARME|nr:malonyl-CoA decarboxylase [Paramagnetospirillum magnetotacticum]KIL98387.1 Malonyl-CoA decarboxylase [Paramagnetospirillum magnetotacticum MS-1]